MHHPGSKSADLTFASDLTELGFLCRSDYWCWACLPTQVSVADQLVKIKNLAAYRTRYLQVIFTWKSLAVFRIRNGEHGVSV